ncbi:MAG: N-acetylmuramoyl-L-alanine amidase [Thiolinea sp.]
MQNQYLTRRNFILKLAAASGVLGSTLLTSQVWAAAPRGKLIGAKLSGNSNALKVSLMLSAPVKYKTFTLSNPDRVVIDLYNTELDGSLKQGRHDRPPLQAIRYAVRDDGKLRVVLDMANSVNVDSAMSNEGVLTLSISNREASTNSRRRRQAEKASSQDTGPDDEGPAPSSRASFVVAIDPGHGGHDPGAIGKQGTQEKDVVLAVAKKLKARINGAAGMRAVLTRSDDRYVDLRERTEIARRNNADLFISIHADANNRANLHGSSVYILSENGASSEAARLLADSENSYELRLGNVRLAGNSDKIASILLDLSQNATMDRSLSLAKRTLRELSSVSNPLRPQVESASFVVLKAPEIPSMLVETAFISNAAEEQRLRSPDYQQQLADAIFKGVRSYQKAYHPNSRRSSYSADAETEDYAQIVDPLG